MGLGGWIKDKAEDAGGAIKDKVDDAGEFLEDAVEDGKETLGTVVNSGAHGLGNVLDEVGLEGAPDFVDARGDDFADMMGADVAEMQLGETDDPKQLIHGEAGKIDEVVGHLKKFASSLNSAATGLSGIDTGGWTGGAAESYKSIASSQPGKWRTAGGAMSSAASAFSAYAHTVTWAQGKAKEAIAQYKKGQEASEKAVKDYNAKVRTYNDGVDAGKTVEELPDKPGPFVDPGTADMEAAEATLKDARTQRDEAADRAKSSITSATEGAPQEPEFTDRVAADVGDFYQVQQVWNAHMLGGALKATGEVVKFARTLNPTDPYNMRNPAAYVEGLSNTITGLVHTANHPTEVVSAIIGSGWTTDPAEAFGKLIPTIVGTAATGGAEGAAAVTSRVAARTATRAAESAAERSALRHVDDLAERRTANGVDPLHAYDDVPEGPRGTDRKLDDPDLEPWLDDVTAQHPELDRDGVRGTWDYTTDDGYRGMNSAMRDPGSADAAIQDRIDATNRGLDQLPPHEGTTYRGTNLPQDVVDHINSGGDYSDRAFSSSSLNPSVSDHFYDLNRPNPTSITIDGHSGVNVAPFSAARGEAEILFRGGTEFRVLDNYVDSAGVRHLTLQEVRP